MKKVFFTAICCAFLFVSCHNDEDSFLDSTQTNKTAIQKSKTSIYKGLKVVDRFNTTNSETLSRNSSEITDEVLFSSSERVAEIVKMILPNFPFGIRSDLTLQMIQNDFPTLSISEIDQNMQIIEDYYNLAFETEFVSTYQEVYKVKSGGISIVPVQDSNRNPADDVYNAICIIDEAGYTNSLVQSIKAIYALYKANSAREISAEEYPNLSPSNTKRDAFRHILWSGLLANNYITLTSKQKRIDFAKAIGDANEVCSVNSIPVREMDLHNNQIGRDAFSQMSAINHVLGIPLGITTPTTLALINATAFEVQTAKFIDLLDLSESQALLEIEATLATQAIYLEVEVNNDNGGVSQCPPGKTFNPVYGECCDLVLIGGQTFWENCTPAN